MSSAPRMRIAVIGGGLAGATVANALIDVGCIEVHIYESAPEFSERGAAVGLSVSSQNALIQIFTDDVKTTLLSKAGGVRMNSTRIMVGAGQAAGSLVLDLAGTDPGIVLHRASILRELLAPLPESILHANKKLTKIDTSDENIRLTFEDGSVDNFDAVIGADGIFSTIRQHVLQDTEGKYVASPAGFWDSRNLVPFDKAKSVLGEEYFELDRQYGWVGPGALIMHDILENRTMVQCVVTGVEMGPPPDGRKRPLTREFMAKTLSGLPDSSIAGRMIDLILDKKDPRGYSQWEHKTTPTYFNGRICIVGDAAHAMTPWQGSGAGQAIEDAMILGTLLKNAKSHQEIEAAFSAYSSVRLPRAQRIIDSSRETGKILCGLAEDVGLDPEKLRKALGPRWNFIYGKNMASYN